MPIPTADGLTAVARARLPDLRDLPRWPEGHRCLVAGLGPVGLLAALALRLRGAEVYGMDVVSDDTLRARWFTHIGGRYFDGRRCSPQQIAEIAGPMELIVEAAGVAALDLKLLDVLARNGVLALTGLPGGHNSIERMDATFLRRLVLQNQTLLLSVNAAREHFQLAVDDLAVAYRRWGKHVTRLITRRYAVDEVAAALRDQTPDDIKVVIEWC